MKSQQLNLVLMAVNRKITLYKVLTCLIRYELSLQLGLLLCGK